MSDKLVLFYWFHAEDAKHGDMGVEVDPSDVPVEMVRDGALYGVDEPVADAIELVAKVG